MRTERRLKVEKNPRLTTLEREINQLHAGAAECLNQIDSIDRSLAVKILGVILEHACTAQSELPILAGLECFRRLDPKWLNENLYTEAPKLIDLSEYWEYSRLMEMLLNDHPALFEQFCRLGEASDSEEIRETAAIFRQRSSK